MKSDAEIIIVENESRNSRLISLGEILKNRFIIPVYQRPYAWSSENFKDLLTTIRESREQKLPAFFGSIIVAEQVNPQSMGKQYILIDGQQRITSFLILLKLLRDKLKVLVDNLAKKREQENDNDKIDTIIKRKIKVEEIIASINEIFDATGRLVREGSAEHDRALALEKDILGYLFKDKKIHSRDVTKIPDIFEEETEDETEGDIEGDYYEYASYVLKRSQFCFLVVQGKLSEDYAIDIFNTFNSTGEALTAFEVLKSIVYKKAEENQGRQMTDKLTEIETSLNSMSMKRNKQTKYTNRLLLFLTMMYEELRTEKFTSFRDRKMTLDDISSKYRSNIPYYIRSIYDLHEFTIEKIAWESRKSTNIFKSSEAAVCFDFLKSISHDRTIPILFKFAASEERDAVVKACAAFTCLWRGVAEGASTDRIDNQYKGITQELFSGNYSAEGLKNTFRYWLTRRWENKKGGGRRMTKQEWIKEFANVNIYKSIKLARFILFVAFHKSTFDSYERRLVKAKLNFITTDNYREYDYKTIEHIVPQSYKAINRIGNLVLLPQAINAKAGKQDFATKKKIYQQCLEKKDVGDGMPYLEILKEVVSYDDNYFDENYHLNEEAIKERGERLGHAVWETLAEDWLGWKAA